MKLAIKWFAYLIGVIMLLWLVSGCRTHKEFIGEKKTYDSTVATGRADSVRMLLAEISRLENVIRQQQYGSVDFECPECPPTQLVVPEDCNVDSLVNALNSLKSIVRIYADGTFEAEGRLKSANFLQEIQKRTIETLERRKDSFALALEYEKKNVKKETVKVTETVEKRVMTGLAWWLIAAAFIAGFVLAWRIKK